MELHLHFPIYLHGVVIEHGRAFSIIIIIIIIVCLFVLAQQPKWARASSSMSFLDHTQRRTTVGRTPLDE